MEKSTNAIWHKYVKVQESIRDACHRADRQADSVKIMLVTKTIPSERIREAIQFGHTLFGENKIQELKTKVQDLHDVPLDWHFIGHLQTNKVKECLRLASMIESVDRMSLVKELDKQLTKIGRRIDVLVQVNTSGEASKFGLEPDLTFPFLRDISRFDTIKVKGLMTLARLSSDPTQVRPCFTLLRNLFEQARNEAIAGIEMQELSMGMSSDYVLAAEEGATIIRVGQAVFGPRSTPDSYYWPEEK